MKTIATTPENTTLIEVSRHEMMILERLADITNGRLLKDLWQAPEYNSRLDFDFSDAFRAIIAWIEVKDKANELRAIADRIDKAIGEKDGE